MADPSAADSQWRLLIDRDDRIRVCNHIFGKLTASFPGVQDALLRERTSALEQHAFAVGDSRAHYLRLIAAELSGLQRAGAAGDRSALAMPPPPAAAALNAALPGVTADHRASVRAHIRRKLANLYRMLPDDIIAKKAESFESVAHANSRDRMDYMMRIARGITNVEKQAASAVAAPVRIEQPHPDCGAPAAAPAAAPPAPAPAAAATAPAESEISGLANNLNRAVIE